jgi:hypothetical protein
MILVIYTTVNVDENLQFFLKKGYLADDDIHYVFVFNNENIVLDDDFPTKNCTVVKRKNVGYDFGAWANGLLKSGVDHQKYDYFIFMNGTVRGPFLHSYIEKRWCDIFTSKLNDVVKLVGTTINCLNTVDGPSNEYEPHVQSMFFVTDKVGLNVLLKDNILEPDYTPISKRDIVIDKEIGMSKSILKSGYNLACMLEIYRDYDFRKSFPSMMIGDHYLPGNYLESNISPYEVIFFKTNRYITPTLLRILTVNELK